MLQQGFEITPEICIFYLSKMGFGVHVNCLEENYHHCVRYDS